ncbi:MAG: hypothetical protein HYT79_05640 [Elusimicrobia bacterium]|nr:hypothetical protein [Elusimicrobiota bacterium]
MRSKVIPVVALAGFVFCLWPQGLQAQGDDAASADEGGGCSSDSPVIDCFCGEFSQREHCADRARTLVGGNLNHAVGATRVLECFKSEARRSWIRARNARPPDPGLVERAQTAQEQATQFYGQAWDIVGEIQCYLMALDIGVNGEPTPAQAIAGVGTDCRTVEFFPPSNQTTPIENEAIKDLIEQSSFRATIAGQLFVEFLEGDGISGENGLISDDATSRCQSYRSDYRLDESKSKSKRKSKRK